MCSLIKYNGQTKGICYLSNPLDSSVFTKEYSEVLDVILTQAAISIQNAYLYKMAITDGLTELYIHKHFKYTLNQELDRSRRYKRDFSLILFDIDFF